MICYPIQKWGFWVWNEKNYGYPMLSVFVIIIILIIISFFVGIEYAPKFEKSIKDAKIKELQEKKKMESELEKELQNNKEPSKEDEIPH